MKLLLDTHTYLWLSLEPDKVPLRALTTIDASPGEVFLSISSLWEMTIKHAKQQLLIPGGSMDAVLQELRQLPIHVLAVEPEDLLIPQSLPQLHKDPFDRILVAQALRYGMTLVTVDDALKDYGVPILWK